jgi:hypothetical protein
MLWRAVPSVFREFPSLPGSFQNNPGGIIEENTSKMELPGGPIGAESWGSNAARGALLSLVCRR